MQDTKPLEFSRAAQRFLVLLSGIALAYVALFLIAAALRASYPLQLEWLEGGVLDAVGRCMRHQGVYVKPTHFWVPFVYMPLYYYLGAVVCKVWGFGFEPLRWLGTICTVGCFVLQGMMAARLSRSWKAGVIAAGFFAAFFAVTGFWYDLVRVDMLFTFLALLGIYLSWRGRPVWAALAFTLAFTAKQTGLIIGICVLLHEYRRPKFLALGLGTFVVLLLTVNLVLTRLYGSWYAYYTRYLPGHQALESRGFFWFIARDLLYPSSIALGMVFWAAWLRRKSKTSSPAFLQSRRLIAAATLGLLAGSLASRMHSGGSVNVTIPLDAWLAILFGASSVFLLSSAEGKPKRLALLAGGAACLQFLWLVRSPLRYIPPASARQEAARELDAIAQTSGLLYVFDNVVDTAIAGKQSFANSAAVFDVLRADHGRIGNNLENDLEQSFRDKTYMGLLSSMPIRQETLLTGAPPELGSLYTLEEVKYLDGGAPAQGTFASDPTHLFPRILILLKR